VEGTVTGEEGTVTVEEGTETVQEGTVTVEEETVTAEEGTNSKGLLPSSDTNAVNASRGDLEG